MEAGICSKVDQEENLSAHMRWRTTQGLRGGGGGGRWSILSGVFKWASRQPWTL